MTLNKLCTHVLRDATHTTVYMNYQHMSLLIGAFLHTWYRLFVALVHTCQHLPLCSLRTRAVVPGYVALASRVGGSARLEVSHLHSSWQGPQFIFVSIHPKYMCFSNEDTLKSCLSPITVYEMQCSCPCVSWA